MGNTHRIEAVFFDLDDTLYDSLSPFRTAIAAVMALPGEFPIEQAYRRVRYHSDRLWEVYAEGKMELHEMRLQRVIQAFAEYGIAVDRAQSAEIQARYQEEQGRLTMTEGVLEVIGDLQRAGYDVGIITNGPVEHQWGKIRALSLNQVIAEDRIFVSDGVGIAKPDPGIFRYVSKATGHADEHCLYVGDSWRNDIAGAIEAGWRSIWLNRRGAEPDTDHVPYAVMSDMTLELREALRALLTAPIVHDAKG
ncbi:putative hydrolase of the HAD superfamily [Paenibacillus phyllosphaerae]|uniref:Putative hydrolase of the HAD superfamily n=1 Tax=Paenibacillus phyllosphaerae TaxID=274593 RepID=A0A7W5FPX4_9BACL|nr:HAD family hydrolase [Paenibacillus phyllosphaerae]MBB3112647.1 putative hydrolase of the HAD superfamily [Paenibacillus phyllosphaerae]